MITFKVGIMGAGKIAHKVAETLTKLEGFSIAAIAAREKERAEEFAKEFSIEKSYGSYEELVNDPEIELVYVATVNSTHAELAKLCINANKPVLVEKPFSHNAITTKEVLDLAKEKNVFCGEALWTKYMPQFFVLMDGIRKGVIGDVRFVNSTFGYAVADKDRILSPELAGGALLDLGIYPFNLTLSSIPMPPISMISSNLKFKTELDAQDTFIINYPQGRTATIFLSAINTLNNKTVINGTKGYVEITGPNSLDDVVFYNALGEVIHKIDPPEGNISGYEYQFLSARKAIITGNIETPEHNHAAILANMSLLDNFRKSWGMFYPLPGEDVLQKAADSMKRPGPESPVKNA